MLENIQLSANKWLVICRHIIFYKLLNRNTWYHITVLKEMIIDLKKSAIRELLQRNLENRNSYDYNQMNQILV